MTSKSGQPPRKDNLPAALSSFIGRERELSELERLVTEHRLVTLTGAGGAGKTRLALKVAEKAAARFRDGAWLVELAPLADPALVPQAAASALGVREQGGRRLTDTLGEHAASRQLLLILDNCEHLLEACARLAMSLLRAAPNLTILTTSREPLGLPGEALWSVAPLALPEPQPWRGPEADKKELRLYADSEAVRLFVERASAAQPGFQLTGENALTVVNLCRRLDGLPLAIELAAARVRALSVAEIGERLDDRFRLLTGGSLAAPPRQQTLEAALDWSHALLTEPETRLLRRLSVFAGGSTLEAAGAVCADDEVPSSEVFDLILRLADRSLVSMNREAHASTRWRMLETIRQYARGKLDEAGETQAFRKQHLDFFVEWAEKAAAPMHSDHQPEWLDRFEADHDNLRAALAWSLAAPGGAQAGLRLAAACGDFWRVRGHFNEGAAHLKGALAREGAAARTMPRAAALSHLAHIAYLQTKLPEMRPPAEEALSIWRELGQEGRAGLADILDLLGELASEEGDYESCQRYFQDSLDLYRVLDDPRGIGEMLMQIGWAMMRAGDYAGAETYLLECLERQRLYGSPRNLTFALSGCGEVALRQGHFETARARFQEALELGTQTGDKWLLGTLLGSLGWVALLEGDFATMREQIGESLRIRAELGDKGGTAWCLEKLSEAAWQINAPAVAVKGFATAATLRAPLGSVIDAADLPDYEKLQAELKGVLGEEGYAAAWGAGERAAVEDVIAELLALESPVREAAQGERARFGGLTRREREVAALIGQGKSNREVAEAMTVGAKTVETYVTRILRKLHLKSRVQIATWAVEQGLEIPSEE